MKVTSDGPVEPVNDFQAVDPRIPMTPANGNFFNPNLICHEQMLDPVSWFGSYEPGIGANPEFLEANAAIGYQFQADTLQNPSFQNLLELVTVGSNGYIGRATSSNATVDFQSGLNYLSSGQVYNYGSSSPYGMPYDFNLLPGGIPDVASSRSISTQFAPIPPEQATRAYKEQSFNARNITENDYRNGELKTNADSQLLVDQASTTLPVDLLEDHAPDKGGGEVGELLKTPHQKSRRKKHRPKVVIEGQKPRTQKPAPEGSTKRKYVRRDNTDPIATPPGSEEKSAGKRKYGKEQEVGDTNSTPLDDGMSINNDIISLRTRSSCRKSLNFESENPQINDMSDLSSMGKCRIVFSDASHDKEVNAVQMMMGSDVRCVRSNCSSSTCLTQETEAEICSPNSNGVKYNSMRSYASTLFPNSTDVSSMSFPVIVKKKRTTKWNKVETSKIKSLSAVIENCETQKAYFMNSRYSVFDYTTVNGKQVSSSSLELADYRNAKRKRSKGPTRPRSSPLGSCEQLLNYRRESTALSQLPATVKTKKRSKRNSTTSTTPLAITWKPMSLMDEVIERLIHLDINTKRTRAMYHNQNNPNLQMSYREQNALVVYQRDGTIVPVRKRKPRPKVDLDDETTRVWRLLLEDIRNEGIDGTDEEKARWWEEERRVFRGRADSFIARMHLVQGDRRFTPWKGSVVDSVVGVFLTQNVSDHLSSSAFMSLAARYPPKSSIIPEESLGEETTMINRDPEVHVLEPDDIVTCHIAGVDETTTEVDIESTQNSVDSSIAQSEKSEINSVCTTEEVTAESEGKLFTSSTSFVELIHTVAGNPELQEVLDSNREPDLSEKKDWCCTTETMIITTQFEEVPKSSSEDENSCYNHGVDGSLGSIVDPELIVESQIRERNMVAKNLPDLNEKPAHSEQLDSIVDSGNVKAGKEKGRRPGKQKPEAVDWDALRKEAHKDSIKRERTANTMDSLDWERIRCADVDEIADTIKSRGMNNMLAERIKAFLDRIVQDHGSTDLEWLRDVLPDKAKEYLLSIRGLGLKSVECVRLLTLHHLAFPVDVNVGRIAVRLGWVPLQPLPESLQLHLLELYPVLESIQKYLWPRLCKLDQRTLYELHYQMITFGKVFCTKSKPNCNACPMRGECRHFASAFASARLTLPAPAEKGIVATTAEHVADPHSTGIHSREKLCLPYANRQLGEDVQSSVALGLAQFTKHFGANSESSSSSHTAHVPAITEPNVEEPPSPEPENDQFVEPDMEDFEDPDEIPTIRLNMEQFAQNLQKFVGGSMELQEHEISNALVALSAEAASLPTPKLKNINRLRTEHQVYELPDSHPLLHGFDRREPDDPSPYLLAIWTPGETADSIQPPESRCRSQETGGLCDDQTCFSCNSTREANSQIVRGTILVPCRTAMRGSFPLNGTYFQVNEVFADHDSSLFPVAVPRDWIWNLPRRTVFFGTSVPSIFKGLNTEEIQFCFWRGFVCVRGFEQCSRSPKPLMARLHFPASRMNNRGKAKVDEEN